MYYYKSQCDGQVVKYRIRLNKKRHDSLSKKVAHIMRPSIVLWRVLSSDSKVGLTVVKLSLQLALEPPEAPKSAG